MIRIDKITTNLPQKMIKGTMAEKFAKARACNIEFYKQLHKEYQDGVVKSSTFSRILRQIIGKRKIGLSITALPYNAKPYCAHNIDPNSVAKGFVLGLEQTISKELMHRNEQEFLMQTQRLFNELYNPKIFARTVALINKNIDLGKLNKFASKNIHSTKALSPEKLDKFLDKKAVQKQIDMLQNMRHGIIVNKNLQKAQYEIDRQIEKTEHSKIIKPYNFEAYQYDEKLKIINSKLAQVLKDARAKHAQKIANKS